MHELSIARNIVDIIRTHVAAGELKNVQTVRVKIGALAGVVPPSLEFSFNALVSDTPLQGSHIEIQQIPFVFECKTCGQSSSNEYGIAICDECGSTNTTVRSGTELHVIDIDVSDCRKEVV